MPCYKPLQAFSYPQESGKNRVVFSNVLARDFYESKNYLCEAPDRLGIPCGSCIGCRLEKSRQWAIRMTHEASMYEQNCFITFTFNEESLKKMCPDGSVNQKHMRYFLDDLRKEVGYGKIRYYYCAEYGDQLGRPHYHMCLFNHDFDDKKKWFRTNGFWSYKSETLSKLWPYGNVSISEFSFDTAGYCSRYVTKKVSGKKSKAHYGDRTPEFAHMSTKPAIGDPWLQKYGMSDVFLTDEVVVPRGETKYKSKPPRSYDRFLEKINPGLLASNKLSRQERAKARDDYNDYERLLAKEKCQEVRFKKLIRRLENAA